MKSFRSSMFVAMIALVLLAACGGGSGNGALSDAEVVARDKASLVIGYAAGDSATGITQNLTLTTHGRAGATIAWASNASDVISAAGVVIRPDFAAGDAAVTLTAALTKGTVNDTRTFVLMVIKAPQKFVHFIVAVPLGSPTTTGFFMPSNLNGWDQTTGAGVQTGALQYEFSIAKGLPGTAVDYKYTRGSWTTVEKHVDGNEVANRTYVFTGDEVTIHDTVEAWADAFP